MQNLEKKPIPCSRKPAECREREVLCMLKYRSVIPELPQFSMEMQKGQLRRHLCRRFLTTWCIFEQQHTVESRFLEPWSFRTS